MFGKQSNRPNKYGINDRIPCPNCKMTMLLARRSPHLTLGSEYELQKFDCSKCGNEIERSVDVDGNAPD
jgi:hypothetical protein